MSQYVHKPETTTIHSKSQLEHFGCQGFDSASTASTARGKQMVVTHEGYVIPLHLRNGLFYMDTHVHTDSNMDTNPHVFLMGDYPCDPNIVDDEFFLDDSISFMDDSAIQLHQDAHYSRIDNYGEIYSSAHISLIDHPLSVDHHEHILETLCIMSQAMK